jgi:hypothetical protein
MWGAPVTRSPRLRTTILIHQAHIMLRDLLTQQRLLILDTPEHVDSENIKLKIGPRSLLYLDTIIQRGANKNLKWRKGEFWN